jgi:hypothetical protein
VNARQAPFLQPKHQRWLAKNDALFHSYLFLYLANHTQRVLAEDLLHIAVRVTPFHPDGKRECSAWPTPSRGSLQAVQDRERHTNKGSLCLAALDDFRNWLSLSLQPVGFEL